MGLRSGRVGWRRRRWAGEHDGEGLAGAVALVDGVYEADGEGGGEEDGEGVEDEDVED